MILINKFCLKKKAQVGAPFEVLIAVILMGFVLLAGSFALKNLSENTCIGNKTQDLSELKSALREVILGSDLTIKTISFDSKSCYNQMYETVKLRTYTVRSKCSAYCQGTMDSCTLLEYTYDDGHNGIKRPIPPLCMDLPTGVDFESDIEGCISTPSAPPEWKIITPNYGATTNSYTDPDNISSGVYKIFKKDIGGSTKVCLLKKIRS
jgi:hypothetical protein